MKKICTFPAKIGPCLQSPVLLLIRLAWGFQLAESGWGHLTNVGKTAEFFQSLHIPFPTANVYLSGTTELVGGILLMVGLFSRLISIPLFFNFCVAYLTASHAAIKELLHFKNPDDFINDSAFPFLVTSLLILAFGPGKISLDYLLEKCCGKKSGASGSGSGS
ncbi:MAG TPA: DoxX family protein [Opitutaceae bacterium]|jgi:putative oxidoreductase|nr:DoxX family protein [Opitutaceae bacterium]